MTEVPPHLLERAARAKARLEGGEVPEASDAGAPSTGTAVATASAPVMAAPTFAVDNSPPPPPSPVVQAALDRNKIPYWAMPVVGLLPLWAVLYVGTLSPAPSGELTVLAEGGEIFAESCASCHGATGGGGAGPALADGAVLETFDELADQLLWVYLGSNGWPEPTYGDTDKTVEGGMPSFAEALTPEQLLAVVRYEREVLSGESYDDVEGRTVGENEHLFIEVEGEEQDSTIYYFGEEAESGAFSVGEDELPLIRDSSLTEAPEE